MYLIFDTETTGLPHNSAAPIENLANWPRLVQLAWQLHDSSGKLLSLGNSIIKPNGFTIPYNAEKIHGISTQQALEVGENLVSVLATFSKDVKRAEVLVGHNIQFDNKIIGAEYLRSNQINQLEGIKNIDTSEGTKQFCQLKGGRGGGLKLPKLVELYEKLFEKPFKDAHDAAYDVDATAKIFFECLKRSIIPPIDNTITSKNINYQAPNLADSNFVSKSTTSSKKIETKIVNLEDIKGIFCHLHGHSQFSVLQATPNLDALVAKAKEYEMPAVALTDLGNMFGAFKFIKEANNAGIKPIIGCEFYVAEERLKLKFTKDSPDKRFRQVLLAKTKKGYKNLIMLSSLAYKEGNYGLFPRIDKALIETYKEDLIALSGSLMGEIPHLILNVDEIQAEKALIYWKNLFGDDFYLEINRHDLEEENRLNEILINFARKHSVKLIASNEFFYLDKKDAKAHDVLMCIKENEKQNTPIGRGRGFRPGLPNENFYFKNQEEIKKSFRDIPEAIENISPLIDKIEEYTLESEILLPIFDIPEKFKDPKDVEDGGKRGENMYLKHLTYEGAKKKNVEINDEIQERLDFELKTIANTGYPGYFLIVMDLISKAREMDVSVGPGRGSVTGSLVAYCINITNVNPMDYGLLFERFLNPDRVSLPDIDIDFDDEGREKAINYVIDKYGSKQVAQIITYGNMAPKSAIRDAGRVMDLPLSEVDLIAKLVPERPGTNFSTAFKEVKELEEIKNSKGLHAEVLNQAVILEGSLRNIGVHPCGVIITPDEMSKFIPLSKSKDSDMMVTQFDNSVIESAGMLKIDFLGLKTLSIIKTAIENIEKSHGIKLNTDTIPLDDKKTYELYQRGETNGIFQFEASSIQKHLRLLKPDKLEDLIAMNALNRPGPMEYIPSFIARKLGKEKVSYDIPEMEEYLAETYGITIYQEQVMLLSQSLAGFTKGEADILRKAMGKKKRDVLEEMKPKFIEQAKAKGHPIHKLEKIWTDWEAFAAYAFNKSHSTSYSIVSYHTGYLKANYPAEYMASVLTHNQSNMSKISFLMEECKNRGIKVLGPHINESQKNFAVSDKNSIRFGIGAIKGTGEAAVQSIIEERNDKGGFKNIFDFAKRVNNRSVNKKSLENLARAGSFDCFNDYHRKQYVEPDQEGSSVIEKAIRYANRIKEEEASAQSSLFEGALGKDITKPKVGKVEPYGEFEKLKIEKEIVGLYISGHPLDEFKFEMDYLMNTQIHQLAEIEKIQGRQIKIGGMVTDVQHRTSKKGNPFCQFTIEDFNDNHTFFLFSNDYVKFKPLLEKNWYLFLTGNIQKKWGNEGELEFKIQNIELLSEIRTKLVKGIELIIDLKNVHETSINKIEELSKKYTGKFILKILLSGFYEEKKMSLSLISRKYTINPTNECMRELQSIDEIKFRVLI